MKISALFIALLVLVGCQTEPGPYVPQAAVNNPEALGSPVVLLDRHLKDRIGVDEPTIVQRNANGMLNIQVGLRNRTVDEVLHIEAQTVFRDDTGHVLYSPLGNELPWIPMRLVPNQTTYYQQTALTPEATKFTVRVRLLRKQPE